MPETTATIEKRVVPEMVEIPGELVVKVIGELEGFAGVFRVLSGWEDWRADSPHDERLDGLMHDLELAAFGEIPGDHGDSDEPWQTDPITVERAARGEEVCAELLEAMIADEDERLGLRRVAAFTLDPAKERAELRRFVVRSREYATAIREAGTIHLSRDAA